MKIVNIKEHKEVIPEVAGWLYNEWGHLTSGSSLEKTITRLRERSENNTIPLTFVALEDGQPVGTISLVDVPGGL